MPKQPTVLKNKTDKNLQIRKNIDKNQQKRKKTNKKQRKTTKTTENQKTKNYQTKKSNKQAHFSKQKTSTPTQPHKLFLLIYNRKKTFYKTPLLFKKNTTPHTPNPNPWCSWQHKSVVHYSKRNVLTCKPNVFLFDK